MANYYCSNCRESLDVGGVNKTAIGASRNLVFCGSCNCYIKLENLTTVQPPKSA